MADRKSKPTARRQKVAAGIVAGKPTPAIAAETGASERTIARDRASSEVQQLIAQLVSRYAPELEALFVEAQAVIRASFRAHKWGIEKTKTPDGCVLVNRVDLGRDHYARLTGVKRLIELFTAGRPTPKAPEPPVEKRTLTLAELEAVAERYALPITPAPSQDPHQ